MDEDGPRDLPLGLFVLCVYPCPACDYAEDRLANAFELLSSFGRYVGVVVPPLHGFGVGVAGPLPVWSALSAAGSDEFVIAPVAEGAPWRHSRSGELRWDAVPSWSAGREP